VSASRFPGLSLSVVIPAYNEEANLEHAVRSSVSALRGMVDAFEVLVIDDCSKDHTYEIAEALALELPEVRAIKNEVNLRQGRTLQKGFALARYALITHNGADYPFDCADLPQLLRHFPAADIVVASRRSYPGVKPVRKLVSWANRRMIRLMLGSPIRDFNFIQVYKRECLERAGEVSGATSFLTPELILRAHYAGKTVVEEVVDYHARKIGVPSSANLKNIAEALRDMGKLALELRVTERILGRR
jgi:glycosyltransferase involved in cell wall biosynthesis